MICKLCGVENEEGAVFCTNCGAQMENQVQAEPAPAVQPQPQPQPQQVPQWGYAPAPALPEKYKPLSAWAYFGYQLLFSIPLVGFILLIVFSLSSEGNINRRNFARSYWCAALVGVIIAIVMVILILVLGGSFAALVDSGMYY